MKAIYFSHDTNSFYDPKVRIIVGQYGVWSYAVFWIILEMMATQKNYQIPLKGFAEGLYPILQSKKITYDSDGGIGFFKDDNGNEIPDDEIGRYSICLATIKDLLSSMIEVCLFKVSEDDFLYSDSLLERMKYREEVTAKRVEAGRLGGLSKSKHLLSSKVKESKVKEKNKEQCFSFNEIYLKYPNKVGKKEALRHFEASVKTPQDWQDIQTALKNYLLSDRVAKGFIQNASTWLNNWQDWIKPASSKVEHKSQARANCDVCSGTGKIQTGEHKGAQCFCVS